MSTPPVGWSDVVELFVVIDTMGGGRLVGAFDSEASATAVVGRFTQYYEVRRCRLNRIDPAVLDWALDDDQRAHLRGLLGRDLD